MPDVQILAPGTVAAPLSYTIPGAQEILLKAVAASFDGTGAAGSFVPTLQLIAPGGVFAASCPIGSTLTAGASADVSWFPGLGSTGSGGAVGGIRTVRIAVDTPDASGNASAGFTIVAGWSNVRRVIPSFVNGLDGTWEGSVQIPHDYASGGTITLRWATPATTGNLRNRVGTSVVADNVSTDTAYTQETYVNTTVSGTARRRFSSSFALSTTLVPDSTLFVQVTRNGSSGSDTCAGGCILFGADLSYVSAY